MSEASKHQSSLTEHNYDTFQANLAQLKVSRTFQELDQIKRRWLSENTPEGIISEFKHSKLKAPVAQQTDTADSRFSKLNQKAEEMKKINLFYLKDVLIKPSASFEEKLECLWKIKRNVHKPVFGMAMKALLSDFKKI